MLAQAQMMKKFEFFIWIWADDLTDKEAWQTICGQSEINLKPQNFDVFFVASKRQKCN